jgi:hypothetical protein
MDVESHHHMAVQRATIRFLMKAPRILQPVFASRLKFSGASAERIGHLIAGLADWRGRTLASLRQTILEADQAIVEEWKWMGSPVWSCQGIGRSCAPRQGQAHLRPGRKSCVLQIRITFLCVLGGKVWRAIDVSQGTRSMRLRSRRFFVQPSTTTRPSRINPTNQRLKHQIRSVNL